PGMTDSEENIKAVASLASQVRNLTKIELLPFKKLCVQKYNDLGLEFPLVDTPECDADTIERLKKLMK
ncbi:MAG: pyruvate formate-lyase 1-activating enzyme, partial [Acutalibacteraceae bacterium]|nr:pyruvate formate-lyase 1-activating enzyme [Acutalibacteraceae bacterium]